MGPRAYYNEIEPYCAQWLRNLIDAGQIPDGDVDERSIEDVRPEDLEGYTQAHFFAGIGGWPLGLRLAGWPDDRPIWTGSCPCQPFSTAGKRGGTADERHLWPAWFWLIRQCQPPVVAGEQVASKDGRAWLAGVQADLETLDYRTAAADLCAAGVGAPHIRQRLWWVGDAGSAGSRRDAGTVSRSQEAGCSEWQEPWGKPDEPFTTSESSRLGDAVEPGLEGHAGDGTERNEPGRQPKDATGSTAQTSGYCWIPCTDGKARRIEPGIEPLVDGFPGRVDQVRAYGNSIVPPLAAQFLMAFMEASESIDDPDHQPR